MKLKRFSQVGSILNTNNSNLGFIRGRKYDMDLGRLGKMDTSHRELSKIGDLRTEMKKLNSELNRGTDLWRDTD